MTLEQCKSKHEYNKDGTIIFMNGSFLKLYIMI